MNKMVAIGDFLTLDQIKAAVRLYLEDRDRFCMRCMDQILIPNMETIQLALGGEIDPEHIAYALEFALMQTELPTLDQ